MKAREGWKGMRRVRERKGKGEREGMERKKKRGFEIVQKILKTNTNINFIINRVIPSLLVAWMRLLEYSEGS
jgi:hypothetical protein